MCGVFTLKCLKFLKFLSAFSIQKKALFLGASSSFSYFVAFLHSQWLAFKFKSNATTNKQTLNIPCRALHYAAALYAHTHTHEPTRFSFSSKKNAQAESNTNFSPYRISVYYLCVYESIIASIYRTNAHANDSN